MLKISKKVLIGTIAGTLLLGGSAFAKVKYGEKISVNYANIKLIINEKVIETKAEPFIYNKNVYVPIATVANMLGLKQQWYNYDGLTGGTPSVRIYDAKNLMPFIVGTYEYSSTNIGGNLYYHSKKGSEDILELHNPVLNFNAPLPSESKEGYSASSKFVISSVYDPNQVFFIVTTEYRKKDGSGYETYFEQYKYKDNGIVRVSSFRIPHEKNVRVKLVRSSFAEPELIGTFYIDDNGKQKLIGTTIYQMEGGKLTVKEELFK